MKSFDTFLMFLGAMNLVLGGWWLAMAAIVYGPEWLVGTINDLSKPAPPPPPPVVDPNALTGWEKVLCWIAFPVLGWALYHVACWTWWLWAWVTG